MREWKALPTENKNKTIKKMVVGSYISIITLNVNGLNVPSKRHDLLSRCKNVHVCTSTYHITLLDPLNCKQLFYIARLIMFSLWLAIVIILYFWFGYWLWKLMNIFYYCDYVLLSTIVLWLVNRKIV